MKTKAAVAVEAGKPLQILEVDLAGPHAVARIDGAELARTARRMVHSAIKIP